MAEYRFRLRLSADQFRAYYEGAASAVIVTVTDGLRIQFPAKFLRRYLTHSGVFGEFIIRTDEKNKLIDIVRIDD
mgnify:CR=1 FL=1